MQIDGVIVRLVGNGQHGVDGVHVPFGVDKRDFGHIGDGFDVLG